MVEFLRRKRGFGFSPVTALYADLLGIGKPSLLQSSFDGVEELRVNLNPLFQYPPMIESAYTAMRVLPHLRKMKIAYDYCVAADPTGWQVAYILQRSGNVRHLIYDDQDYFPRHVANPLGRPILAGFEKLIVMASDVVVSASETLARLRRQQGARRTEIVPNGVDPSYLEGRVDFEGRREKRTILYAGSLDHRFGVDLLLQAFALLQQSSEAHLTLAGVGPLEGWLRRQIQSLSLQSCVRLLGRVEHDALREVMCDSTIGVAPYRVGSGADYGVPMKVKEYLATGLPVVTTRVGEIPYFLDQHKVGFMVDEDPEELSAALGHALEMSVSEYAEMSANGRALVASYSWDDLFSRYFEVFTN